MRPIHSHGWAVAGITVDVRKDVKTPLQVTEFGARTEHTIACAEKTSAGEIHRGPQSKRARRHERSHGHVPPEAAREASDNKRDLLHLVQVLCLSVTEEDPQP